MSLLSSLLLVFVVAVVVPAAVVVRENDFTQLEIAPGSGCVAFWLFWFLEVSNCCSSSCCYYRTTLS